VRVRLKWQHTQTHLNLFSCPQKYAMIFCSPIFQHILFVINNAISFD